MTYVLIAAFALFLIDNRKIKWILLFLLPAFLILPAFFRMNSLSGWAFYTGLIIIGLSPFLEKLFGKIVIKKPGASEEKAAVTEDSPKEDILDNKKKWRLIVSGYVIFIIFALLSIGAMFTLNMKINNIYEFSNSQQETIEQQQSIIDSQQEQLKKQELTIKKLQDKAESK